MVRCQCIIASGPRKNQQCDNTAKFPPIKPLFCGWHKTCTKEIKVPDEHTKVQEV